MPRVSVLVATYNAAPFVRATVASVLSQTYTDLEVIVVDDGSTDGTVEVLGAYAGHPRVRLDRQTNAGPSAAFNRARSLAGGQLLAVLDGDDLCWPERIERQVRFLDDHPKVGLVGTGARLVNENGVPFGVLRYPCADAAIRQHIWRGERGPHPAFCGASMMFRAEAMDSAGGWVNTYKTAQDTDVILRVAERTQIANLSDVLYDYRIHGAQISQDAALEKAAARYAVREAARSRRRGEAVPAWCISPPSRAELEHLLSDARELDRMAYDRMIYIASTWALRGGHARVGQAAQQAALLAGRRRLGKAAEARARVLSAIAAWCSGDRREASRELGRAIQLSPGAVSAELRAALGRRAHRLRHRAVLSLPGPRVG